MSEGYKQSQLRNIPKEWTVSTIDKEASICTGGKDTQDKIEDGIYPFFVRSNTIERINSYSFDGEAVLTSGDGVGVGKIYHYLNCKFDYHQRVYNIHSFSEKLNGRFFYYFFSNHFYERVMRLSAKNSVDSVRRSMISDMEIPLPPLPEQQKIAEILSTVDAKIEVIDQQINETQALKKGLMQRLLTKGIGHTEFKDSALGEIPKSWEVVSIDEIAKVTAGGTPSTQESSYWGGEIPWMNSGEINLRRIKSVEGRITDLGLKNSSTKIIQTNSVLMALAGQGKTRGKVAINEIPLCTNQSLATIYDFKNAHYEYVFQNLETRYSEIRKMSTGDGGRGGLNLTIIKTIKIALPPLDEQTKMAEIFMSLDEKLDVLGEKKTHYQELKQGLMQQLLTGKIRVKTNNTVTA